MEREQLQTILRDKGIVGAGGGGYPSYAKLGSYQPGNPAPVSQSDYQIDTVIVNGAECEPLIHVDKLLLARYAREVLTALDAVRESIGAAEGIVALKRVSTPAVSAVNEQIGCFANLRTHLLDDCYPAGDELVLTYDVTGRVIPQGGLPMAAGVAVFNTETVYNIYRALFDDTPVTHTWLTVNGAVEQPTTMRVPVGARVRDVLAACTAERLNTGDYAVLLGGVMTGRLVEPDMSVDKTTKAVMLLPIHSKPVTVRRRSLRDERRRAMSACSQCRMCTDLCPRALLGHDTLPHVLMRAISAADNTNTAYLRTLYCSGCGLCEMYACHQGLSPRRMSAAFKSALREQGINPAPARNEPKPHGFRSERRVPDQRLIARLGLSDYAQKPVRVLEPGIHSGDMFKEVWLSLKLPIGADCIPTVQVGESVTEGQPVACPPDGKLGTVTHASISGVVTEITEQHIRITAQ